MATHWTRRRLMAAACACAALLAGCGSSSTESAIAPQRLIAFGDAMADLGQNGWRYTVNDGSVNNWTLQVANHYGKPLAALAEGGTSYATGNARISAKPDAAGNGSTLTLTEQIDAFLARDGFAPGDLVIVSAGISDLIAAMAEVSAGRQSEAQMLSAARKAGEDMAVQIQRLVRAGASHVLVSGSYDLSKTPWAKNIGRQTLLGQASSRLNEGLLIGIVDLGASVLYVDAAYFINLYTSAPASYGFSNATTPVCTSVDPGNAIGIGAGQVSSARCNGATLLAGAKQDAYVFADSVYLTPSAQRQFGTHAVDRLRARW